MREVNATSDARNSRTSTATDSSDDAPSITSQAGPWAMVPIWVLSMGLTGGEVAVYVSLRSFCDRNGHCYPKTRTIAERAHCSVSAARNAVQKFRTLGILTTTEVYRPGTRELSHLRYYLADLDPRRWNVEPREVSPDDAWGVTQPSDTCTSAEVGGSLSQVTQEHTSDHPTQQTKEDSSSSRSSSSSSPRARREDDDEARERKIEARKRKERAAARRKVIARTDTDTEKADALLDYLIDNYSAGNLDRYVDGLNDEDLTDRLDEATWAIEAEREAHAERVRMAQGITRQLAEHRPGTDAGILAEIEAAYVEALRQGHDEQAIVDAVNRVHTRSKTVSRAYVDAIEALGQPAAA